MGVDFFCEARNFDNFDCQSVPLPDINPPSDATECSSDQVIITIGVIVIIIIPIPIPSSNA